MKMAAFGLMMVALACSAPVAGEDRQIRVSLTVPIGIDEAWQLWTTDEGVRSFFAPGCHIDLRVDGAYEIFFAPQAPAGLRGADGMRLLAVEPNRRLAFTWNAPPILPAVRAQRTMVIVDFEPVASQSARARTRVTLRHIGWGRGPEWDDAVRYFESAWNGQVMPYFRHRVEHGRIDWAAPPKVEPIAASAIETLTAVRR